jgi:branched-chain amino acid transport system ATP-binding protein
MTLLQVENLTRRFGALEALADVSVTVDEGEVFGLIGPNGSGKTTFFNVITGIYPPSLGRILLDGQSIGGMPPHEVSRQGMARTFQNLRLVPQMSVFDNIWLAQHQRPGMTLLDVLSIGGARERARRSEVEELMAKCGLADMRDSLASDLPLPDQRRLEIARALARKPRLLLLDEPAGGMTPLETQDMARMIREVAAPGRTLIVIEHKMDLISGICDRAAVLHFGAKIAEGTPAEVLSDPHVLDVYLGKQADHA